MLTGLQRECVSQMVEIIPYASEHNLTRPSGRPTFGMRNYIAKTGFVKYVTKMQLKMKSISCCIVLYMMILEEL